MTERVTSSGGAPRGVLLTDKHIVFAVMTATAVGVIVFLCGVFVGRGVLAARPADDLVTQDGGKVLPDGASPGVETEPGGGAFGDDGGSLDNRPPAETGYTQRLTGDPAPEKLNPLRETLSLPQPPPEAPPESPVTTPQPASRPQVAEVRPSPAPVAAAKAAEDPGKGPYTVQVASVRLRPEAARIVEKLKKKGFPAYLFDPAPGARSDAFRVRVGKYKSRQEADAMAARLQKEEKYKPWITRLPS